MSDPVPQIPRIYGFQANIGKFLIGLFTKDEKTLSKVPSSVPADVSTALKDHVDNSKYAPPVYTFNTEPGGDRAERIVALVRDLVLGDGFIPTGLSDVAGGRCSWMPPATHCLKECMEQIATFVEDAVPDFKGASKNPIEGLLTISDLERFTNPRVATTMPVTETGTAFEGPTQFASKVLQPGYDMTLAGSTASVTHVMAFLVARDEDNKFYMGWTLYNGVLGDPSKTLAKLAVMIPEGLEIVFHALCPFTNDGWHRRGASFVVNDDFFVAVHDNDKMAFCDVSWTNKAYDATKINECVAGLSDNFISSFLDMATKHASPARRVGTRGAAKDPMAVLMTRVKTFLRSNSITAKDDEVVKAFASLVEERNQRLNNNAASQQLRESSLRGMWEGPFKNTFAGQLYNHREPDALTRIAGFCPAYLAGLSTSINQKTVFSGILGCIVHWSFSKASQRVNPAYSVHEFDEDVTVLRCIDDTERKFTTVDGYTSDATRAGYSVFNGEVVNSIGPINQGTTMAKPSMKSPAVQKFINGVAGSGADMALVAADVYFLLSRIGGVMPKTVNPLFYYDYIVAGLIGVAAASVGEIPCASNDEESGVIVLNEKVREKIVAMAKSTSIDTPSFKAVRAIANRFAAGVDDENSGLIFPAPPASSSHKFSKPVALGSADVIHIVVAHLAVAALSATTEEDATADERVTAFEAAVKPTQDSFVSFLKRAPEHGGFALPSRRIATDLLGKIGDIEQVSSKMCAFLFGVWKIMSGVSLQERGCLFNVVDGVSEKLAIFLEALIGSEVDIDPKLYRRCAVNLVYQVMQGLVLQDDVLHCVPEGKKFIDVYTTLLEIRAPSKQQKRRQDAKHNTISEDFVESSDEEDDAGNDSDSDDSGDDAEHDSDTDESGDDESADESDGDQDDGNASEGGSATEESDYDEEEDITDAAEGPATKKQRTN